MNFIFFLLILFSSSVYASKINSEFLTVNPYTLPGDVERNHLSLSGISYHDANDFFGKTDKLVTQVSSLTVAATWKEKFASSISYKGRFMQPIVKTRYGEDELPAPLGLYAEWLEIMVNQSFTHLFEKSKMGIKLDGGIGYNDFGDHTFADYHRKIHSAVGSKNEENRYGDIADANFMTTTASAAILFAVSNQINLMGSYQVMNSEIFREDAQEISLVWNQSEETAASLKYSFVNQIRSEFYRLKNHRTQIIAAVRLFKVWTPSLMYVSTFVRGDKFGQWYLTPLSVTYPF